MYKEVYNHRLPVLLKTGAVTLRKTIYYKKSKEDVPEWLRRHELVHIKQYAKYGVVGFLSIYSYHYLKGRINGKSHWGAYLDIPFEVEARKAERKKETD